MVRTCGPRNPTLGTFSACCARVRNGFVSAAPQATRPMNSRRLTFSPPRVRAAMVATRAGAREGACAGVRFGPKADITELGFHQRLDFTSLIVVFVAPLPFHCSPLSSSPAKQLG